MPGMDCSLFPYGKSGLKLREEPAGSLAAESLPVWEEWIEIPRIRPIRRPAWSLPVWEEWIEIPMTRALSAIRPSLPVWEEWIEMHISITVGASTQVSSRMGRVD